MATDTIRLANGQAITGRIVDHLGGGLLELDVDGRRFVGPKLRRAARTVAR